MIRRFSATATAVFLVFLGMAGCKSIEGQNDPAPEKLSGTIAGIYGPDVPLSNGKKCTYGSFTIGSPDGTLYTVCADSKAKHDAAHAGDQFSRG
jgi:hypothetical protein